MVNYISVPVRGICPLKTLLWMPINSFLFLTVISIVIRCAINVNSVLAYPHTLSFSKVEDHLRISFN